MELNALTDKVLSGETITKAEALYLWEQPLGALCRCGDRIRRHFCANGFDLCTIINGKSGRCSEDCKFCAQAACHRTGAAQYALLPPDEIVERARSDFQQGVLRYSIVTSGKRLSPGEVDAMCGVIRRIREEVGISVCVSFGLLSEDQFRKLKEAGVQRVHNNLETSRRYFPQVCTTHTFDDKVRAIRAAQAAGLSVCSGGIMGLGETPEDRIDMALCLRELGVRSVPVNVLNPVPGTPFADRPVLSEGDVRRIVAVYRFLLPEASIRLAGVRGLLPDRGRSCFQSGANAAISGDMLTTAGISTRTDLEMLKELGYEARACNG